MNLDYSVIIRSTGKANEKYTKLLSSISKLDPKPYEVIVVLPKGSLKPESKLINITYYFCEKGMVNQRLFGIIKCKTRYALICDDDVCFKPDFVNKLCKPVLMGICSFTAGPLFDFLPSRGINSVFSAFILNATPTLLHKNKYTHILASGGYSYNRHLRRKYYEAHSVPWTCFFADLKSFYQIDFEKEIWLDSHGYSSLDDQTMFYKAWLRGLKTVVVSNAYYLHLDAKTSLINNNKNALFSLSFNRIVFWHRFIYSQQPDIFHKLISLCMFKHRLFWLSLLDRLNVKRGRLTVSDLLIIEDGKRSAYKYIRSSEYNSLPPVK